ncbi:SpoIIE family protein phosphatase [Streptomyces sp. NPDC091268]|uniref:SpoIIE family protein phosphatase n=1 Tax=Streptomyces sp. NPDC091268 TaxID=3365979 RepID=UPI003820519B
MTSTRHAPTAHVRIDHYSAVHLAAETARSVAKECGLPGAMPDQAAVVASELASNLAKHARDGSLYVQALPLGGGLEVLTADHGPGMADIERCLTDGYTTTGTLGTGLGAVRRIATDFMIASHAVTGTLVCARLTSPDQRGAATSDVALIRLPATREEHCGDAAAVFDHDLDHEQVRTAAVVDGLGHGIEAAEAAQAAIRSLHAVHGQPLPDIMTAMHRALRHTRGAAVGLLRSAADRIEYCGVGNVRMVAVTHDQAHHRLTGQPGLVGWKMPTPRTHTTTVAPGTTTLLHSDGIDHRWTHTPSPHLLRLLPPLLALDVAHRHHNHRDDATVLAIRPRRRHS